MKSIVVTIVAVSLAAGARHDLRAEAVREAPLAAFRSDPFRPQLRYTPKYGWMNDPNGLIYDQGKWHFFCQHNPTNVVWGNMHWNHAVSDDLVHWQELGEALCPDDQGTMFSGSAVADRGGVAGFGRDVQVLFYTHAVTDGFHFAQRIAWSKDRLHYTKVDGDPAVPFRARKNRDPKVFWHAPTKRWVMALYGTESGRHTMWIYSSENLRDWTPESSYRGGVAAKNDLWLFECPGLEELGIEGETNTAWVVWGAMPEYAVGDFDGRRFAPVEERIPGIAYVPGVPYHGNEAPYYAAQTFNDAPDGRKIWMAWFRLPPREGATTRHSASLPHELSLRRTPKGLRLVRRPARELEKLRTGPCVPLERYSGELAEIRLSCQLAGNGKIAFDLRGVGLSYDAQRQALKMAGTEVPWALNGRKLDLIVYLDRVGAEIFSGDGLQMAPIPDAFPDMGKRTCSVVASSGAEDCDFRAFELKSIWNGMAAVSAFGMNPATASALPVPGKASGTHVVHDALQPYVDGGQCAGLVSILYNKGVCEVACVGWADREAKRPMTLDSMYMIASQSKGVCGVAAAILIDDGKLNLDDPVCKYLPAYSNLTVWATVRTEDGKSVRTPVRAKNRMTVRNLLTHTAGFPFESPVKNQIGWTQVPVKVTAAIGATTPLSYEPGSRFAYSNFGMDVAAAVVESASGLRIEEFLRSRLFEPLGMKDTTFWPTDEQLSRAMMPYYVGRDNPARRIDGRPDLPRPYNGPDVFPSLGAGLWSSPRDLVKFYRMLMNRGVGDNGVRILKPETVMNLLEKDQIPATAVVNENYRYSLGLQIDGESGWYGHGGAWTTDCRINPKEGKLKFLAQQISYVWPKEEPKPFLDALHRAEDEFLKRKPGEDASGAAFVGRTRE